MSHLDVNKLEDQVTALLDAYKRVQVENETLTREFAQLTRQNSETKRRLQAVIDRIRALEAEAEAQEL